jgi:hypothetical protein
MLDTKKIEEIVEALSHVIIAGKKISADKKVNLEDLPAAMELIVKLPSIAAAFADIKLAVEEAKDLDVAEVVALIKKIDDKVKEIEQA